MGNVLHQVGNGPQVCCEPLLCGAGGYQEGPLVYANITERDSLQRPITHTISDERGRFSFKLKNPDDRIVISYVGMETCILEITDTVYEVILKLDDDGMPLINRKR